MTVTGDERATPNRVFGLRLQTAARLYFAMQAFAGAAWWMSVFTVEAVQRATLGDLDPVLVAMFDLPLFVLASAIAAFGTAGAVDTIDVVDTADVVDGRSTARTRRAARARLAIWARRAVWVAVPWTVIVAAFMAGYATITRLAGSGAVLMLAAAACSVLAGVVLLTGEVPGRLLLIGPFAFREARPASRAGHLGKTIAQMLVFWGLFLVVFPLAIYWVEDRWRLRLELSAWVSVCGLALLIAATALGVWSAISMATRGDGTPLPSATASRLVIAGPYRFVRNPMAVAGIAQAVGVGLMLGSWLVVLYALCGSLLWNWVVRPLEEADLEARFGPEFAAYCERVSCWLPRWPGQV